MAKWNLKFWNNTPKVEKDVSHYSFNRSTSWNVNPDYNLSAPFIDSKSRGRWVNFGEDNLYPQLLLGMYHGSPFHAALINFKTKAMMANGLIVSGVNKTLEDKLVLEKLRDKLNRVFLRRFIQEYLIHERVNIKITKLKDKVTGFEIISSEKVRVSLDGNLFYVSDTWNGRTSSDVKEIPKYDKYKVDEEEQMLQFENMKPGFDIYTVPEYSSANNWIWLDSEIAFFQKQNIENSINPSAIIKFYKDIANKEEKEVFVSNLKGSFTSAQNAGKIMVFFSNGKDAAPDITIAEPNKLDKAFAGTQENIIKNVAYAHMVNPVLMGVSTAGKLGSSNEINEAFSIFKSVWLNNAMDNVEDFLNDLVHIISPSASVRIDRQDTWINPIKTKDNE